MFFSLQTSASVMQQQFSLSKRVRESCLLLDNDFIIYDSNHAFKEKLQLPIGSWFNCIVEVMRSQRFQVQVSSYVSSLEIYQELNLIICGCYPNLFQFRLGYILIIFVIRIQSSVSKSSLLVEVCQRTSMLQTLFSIQK